MIINNVRDIRSSFIISAININNIKAIAKTPRTTTDANIWNMNNGNNAKRIRARVNKFVIDIFFDDVIS